MSIKQTSALIFVLLLGASVLYSQEGWRRVFNALNGDTYDVMRIQHMKHGVRRVWIRGGHKASPAVLHALGALDARNSDTVGKPTSALTPAEVSAYLGEPVDTIPLQFTEKDSLLLHTTEEYNVQLEEFDCSQRRSRTLAFTAYFYDGHPESENLDSSWQFVPPETVWDTVLNYVCSH